MCKRACCSDFSTDDPAQMNPAVTLQRLAYFAAVAENESFRQAAQTVSIQQSGLSAQIETLEAGLGAKLFERSRRGTRLTSLGAQLLPKAVEVTEAAERFAEYCSNVRAGTAGVVSIACYPVHLERFLATVVGSFQEAHPEIRVDLTKIRDDRRRDAGRSVFEELLAREVDLAMGPPQPLLPLEGIRAWDATIVLVLPDGHPDRHAPQLSIASLEGKPLLIAPGGYFSREKVATAARAAGFSLEVAMESSSPPALVALGNHGVGWPVVPDDYSVVGQNGRPYPVIVDVEGQALGTPVWLHWRRDDRLVPAAELFIESARKWMDAERKTPGIAATRFFSSS